MLLSGLEPILASFSGNVESVKGLMTFDQMVLNYAITHLEALQDRLVKVHEIANARLDVSNALLNLKRIHQHDSLRHQYDQMHNQCNVLLVSYFSSAVADIFRMAVTDAVKSGCRPKLLKQEIKVGLDDVRDIGAELAERAGELFVKHQDISFQDMQSIGRAFREYFDYEPPRTEIVNDIIVSQACRHVIVHSGSVVDRRMVGQVRNALPRSLKPDIRESQRVQFSEDEIVLVGNQMTSYLQDLAETLNGYS